MDRVWLLWFEQERDGEEDTELLIGVYRNKEAAEEAIGRLKSQPGFRDYPQGFSAYEQLLDKYFWTEGFVRA